MLPLWHFTCDHGHEAITTLLVPGRDVVVPANPDAVLASPFVWLTDLQTPIREALGLTMNYTSCDRTVHRYRVTDPGSCVHWTAVRRALPQGYVEGLEAAPGARPAHWWISAEPVHVVYDPIPEVATR